MNKIFDNLWKNTEKSDTCEYLLSSLGKTTKEKNDNHDEIYQIQATEEMVTRTTMNTGMKFSCSRCV